MDRFDFRRPKTSKTSIRPEKRKGRGGMCLRLLDLGLFAGFICPLLLHLRLFSFTEALIGASLGLTLATLAIWSLSKTKENNLKIKEREDRQWWG